MADRDGGLSRCVWDGLKDGGTPTDTGLKTGPLWHPDALLRAALDACADPIAIKDTTHRFLFLNPAMARMLGQAQETVLGKTLADLIPGAQAEPFTADERAVLDTGAGVIREHPISLPRGVLWVSARTDPLMAAGACTAVMIVMRDVTERVHRDRALRRSEESYRDLAELPVVPIVKVDAALRFTYVNPAYFRLFGQPPRALLGKSFLPLVHEEDRAATAAGLASLADPPHICTMEQRALTVYGWRWLAWQNTALLDDQGQVREIVGVGWDTTAQREAAHRLATTVAELKRAQRIARIGNWSLDPAAGLSEWSDEVYRIYERDPALGPPFLVDYDDIFDGPDRATFRNALEQAIQTGLPFEITLCLRLPAGRIKWIHALGEPDPTPGPAGHIVRGTFQDATSQREVEQALRRSEARHRLITESASDIIGLHGTDGLIHYVSPAFQAVLGWPPEKVVGSSPITLIAPEYRPTLRGALKEALMGIDVAPLRYRIYHRDGYWVWLETRLSCVRDPESKTVTEVIAVSRDITLQVRREDDLRRNRQLYKGLFDTSSAAMLLIDPDSGEILKANSAAATFYGYSRAALQRMFIEDLNVLSTDQLREERRRAREGECTLFQFRHRLASGEIRDVEVNATPLDLDGRIVLFSIVHDTTDRIRAEEALRASEREKALILGSVSDLVTYYTSPDKTVQWCNRATAEALNTTVDSLIGTHCYEHVYGRQAPCEDCPVERCFTTKLPAIGERETPDRRVWSLHAYPAFDDQGALCGVVKVGRDVTERRAGAAALARSLENFHAFFDSSPDFLTVLDSSGRLLAVNRAVEDRLGWSAEALVGQPVSILHPQDMGEQAAACARLLLGNESRSQTCTLPLVTRDGRYVPVETTVVHGTWNGQPAVFGTSRDVTELALSRQMFEISFRDNATVMLITDPETGRVIDANHAGLSIMGWQASDVIGRTTVELGLIPGGQERETLLKTLLETDRAQPLEMEFVTASGDSVVGQVSARLISSGMQTFVLVMATDVTRQKALMKALEDRASDVSGVTGPSAGVGANRGVQVKGSENEG